MTNYVAYKNPSSRQGKKKHHTFRHFCRYPPYWPGQGQKQKSICYIQYSARSLTASAYKKIFIIKIVHKMLYKLYTSLHLKLDSTGPAGIHCGRTWRKTDTWKNTCLQSEGQETQHRLPQAILTLTVEECDGEAWVSSFRLFCSAKWRNGLKLLFLKADIHKQNLEPTWCSRINCT